MSSIIVLDSSDEDESPPKKANVNLTTDISAATNTTGKNHNVIQRAIPSGITITPRLSPTAMSTNNNFQSLSSSALAGSYQALNSIINNERQSPTPPKGHMTSSFNQRKRKTPTPPQGMPRLSAKSFGNISSSPAKAATTLAPLPPIMPMITGVHSMAAAGSTPPLQLMATSHNLGSFMGLNENLMMNPHLLPSVLPPNTTITAHSNPNQNNINNNYKIHLPFNKPSTTTPSPAASPAPKTPSPQLTASPQPSRSERNAKRVKPHTILKSSDENWQKQKQFTSNDKHSQRTPISLNNDVVIEMLPPSTESPKSMSASSSRHHTPMTSPSTPKSQKSPDVIMITPPTDHTAIRKDSDTILDLTHSPGKVTMTNANEIVDLVNTFDKETKPINGDEKHRKADKNPEKPPPRPPLEPEYEELIKACREADPSKDMEKLIKSKLIKYYYEVHSDYVKSKSFRKNIRKVMETIKSKPDLVYYNLKNIVEELKVRRKVRLVEEAAEASANAASVVERGNSVETVPTAIKATESADKNACTDASATATSTSAVPEEISATATPSTGNKKVDEQIKKLNKALYVLTKRIEVLEQSDVDWDDDDSSYLQVERFKKRACQIYEKICDLTGESKNAHRLVKKPIKFNETRIPQFNKTLQAFINRTKEFPDYFDVLRMLEHCNRTYSLGLVNFEIKNIAEDAFIKVGKLLQTRRKADLYEMVTHFAGDGKDPAKTDPILAAKLNENLKNHKKISDILEKFARKQDMPEEDEEEEEKAEKMEVNSEGDSVKTEVTVKNEAEIAEDTTTEILGKDDYNKEDVKNIVVIKREVVKTQTQDKVVDVDEDEDDDDDDEEEDEENLDEQVETLANGDMSDNESDNEILKPEDSKNSINNMATNHEIRTHSLNNDSLETKKCAAEVKSTNTNNLSEPSVECVTDYSRNMLLPEIEIRNVIHKESTTIKIKPKTDNLFVNNNNNVDISPNTTKTVENAKSNESLSPLSSPIPKANTNPTANGKLKDIPSNSLLNHDDTTPLYTFTDPAAAATKTTTADLKIVHVSSLEPNSNNTTDNGDDTTLISKNDIGSNITSTKKTEEIIISDEES